MGADDGRVDYFSVDAVHQGHQEEEIMPTNGTKKIRTPQRKKHSAAVSARVENGLVTHEQIARRAYEIYLTRGGEPGREQEDWLQAERELRERHAKS